MFSLHSILYYCVTFPFNAVILILQAHWLAYVPPLATIWKPALCLLFSKTGISGKKIGRWLDFITHTHCVVREYRNHFYVQYQWNELNTSTVSPSWREDCVSLQIGSNFPGNSIISIRETTRQILFRETHIVHPKNPKYATNKRCGHTTVSFNTKSCGTCTYHWVNMSKKNYLKT
jgi:hypothetical protein